jgi:ADP-heptose:LPS heptosyltransferase
VTLVAHKNDALPQREVYGFDAVWRGPLTELAQLISTSQAVIAVDSFVGHLAAAIGTPVVSLFEPPSPERWRPCGEHNAVIMVQGYPCRPCGQKRCVHPDATCMDAIHVEQVMQAFNELMSK